MGYRDHFLWKAPPRSRGWTQMEAGLASGGDGSPALAGMDPIPRPGLRARRRLPRARGDGPRHRRLADQRVRAPPRSRGWTRDDGRARLPVHGSPALAGMDPYRWKMTPSGIRLPRARGDGPYVDATTASLYQAPPRSRGWTLPAVGFSGHGRGSPALAGMDPSCRIDREGSMRLPRARGDGPRPGGDSRRADAAPPRSRGWTRKSLSRASVNHGSPALAGMDPTTRANADSAIGLPRARGDGPISAPERPKSVEAPPRSRGWTPCRRCG